MPPHHIGSAGICCAIYPTPVPLRMCCSVPDNDKECDECHRRDRNRQGRSPSLSPRQWKEIDAANGALGRSAGIDRLQLALPVAHHASIRRFARRHGTLQIDTVNSVYSGRPQWPYGSVSSARHPGLFTRRVHPLVTDRAAMIDQAERRHGGEIPRLCKRIDAGVDDRNRKCVVPRFPKSDRSWGH